MKTIVPDYYKDFSCIARDCVHNCCLGWEIDIDDKTLEKYDALPGSVGEKLRRNILRDASGARFRLDEGDRCPFLTREGLCELILNCGEDILCDICADHPRFRNFFSDRVEMGLGLCCEAACSLILGREAPVALVTLSGIDEGETPSDEERALLDFREKIITRMQDRTLPVAARVETIAGEYHIPVMSAVAQADLLMPFERMDEAWTGRLEELKKSGEDDIRPDESEERMLEQLMVYLLYRHMPLSLEDGDAQGHLFFCVFCWTLAARLFALDRAGGETKFSHKMEIVRLMSAEIEYSQENTDAVIEALNGF